jgi:hypothetical protein
MRSRLLLFLLLLLPAWAAWAQAPAWQSAYGVPASARAVAAATNAAGDVFITGTYSSATTFGSTPQLSFGGGSADVFLAKWSNTSRTFVWAVSVSGSGTDQAGDVAVNGTNVYLTGGYTGNATISGNPRTSTGSALNLFVAKYTDGGSSVTNGGSVSSGGTSNRATYGSGIAVSGTNVYVTGTFAGTNGGVTIAGTALTGTTGSFFLAKYVDSNGLTGSGAVTASSTSTVRGLDVAVSGTSPINIYVAGFYRTSAANTGVTTISGSGLSSDGVNDAFLAKYTDSGSGITNGVAVKAGGNDGADTGQAVAVSGSNVYLIGTYGSTTGTFGSTTLTNPNGGSNGLAPAQGFVAKYIDGGSTLTGSTAYVIGNQNSAANSSDSATPFGVAASGSTVYVTGSFSGSVNISNTSLTTSNGSEIFLGKYTDAGGAFTQDGAIRAGGTGNGATGFDDVGYAVAFSGTQAVVAGTLESSTTASFGTTSVAAGSTSFISYLAQPTTTVVSIVPAGTSPTNAASVQFTVTFAASVTGLTTSNFTTSNGTGVTGSSVTSVSGSGTTYTVTVNTGNGSGTLGLTLANDTGLTPGISNEPFTGTPLYTIDKTAPTVTNISSTAGSNGSTTTITPIPFSITFSESVTGFIASDVTVSGGTLTSSSFSGSGAGPYAFTVTPSGSSSTVTVSVAANVTQDAAGNGNTASSQFSINYQQTVTASSQAVTVNLNANGSGTLTASNVNNGSTGGGTLTYTIQKIAFGYTPESTTPLTLTTPNGANFTQIRFASYGTPNNNVNGNYSLGSCSAANSLAAAQNAYVGRSSGAMYASNTDTRNNPVLGDPCGGTPKALAVQVGYSADAASLAYDCTEAGKTQYVLLTVSNGTTTSTSVAQVTVNPPPTATISSVNPSAAQRGTTVTVSGTNLSGINSLMVNGATATVSSNNGSSFTFVVPTGATAGDGTLSVTAPCAQTVTSAFTVQVPTAAPVVTTPANNSFTNTRTVTAAGTAPANSIVSIYIGNNLAGTTQASATGAFSFVIPGNAPDGTYTVSATAQSSGATVSARSNINTFTVDGTAPTVTSLTSSTVAANGTTSTSPVLFTATFSEPVTGFTSAGIAVSGGTVTSGPTAGSGNTFSFQVTPSGAGNVTVQVRANAAQDQAGNLNPASASYAFTYSLPSVTVVSVTRLTPSPTATAQVSYQVVFSGSVANLGISNFDLSTSGLSGTGVTSVSGSGTTYTVVVNTGTGNGTLTLNVANTTGTTPTISNVPYTSGEQYTITKTFAAAPTLRIQAAGSASGNGDVTAFVDLVRVLQSGTSNTVTGALQNASFEFNNVDPNSFKKTGDGVVASPWSFTGLAGISRNNSAFGSTAADGDAVALIQSAGDNNASISQNLAVPTGSYQVNFQAMQRDYTSKDQQLNAFLVQGGNTVFIGNIQPNNSTPPTYDTFTSATFNVSAPALTATVSTTSASPTSTSPIPFSVSFSQSVGTSFTASDVTVTGGTLTSGSFSGSGAGPYTFTVTPSGTGNVTVSLAANVTQDANNTGNLASNTVTVQYNQLVTAAPVVTAPANGSLTNNPQPTYTGTAPANSTVTVYVGPSAGTASAIGTTTASASGNFTLPQVAALTDGTYRVYATAQTSGATISANSNTNTFTVDTTVPTVTSLTSSTVAANGTTSTSPVLFTATFSEPVAGFTSAGITVSNGTVTSGPTAGSGNTFTFQVTPSGAGNVTVQVRANAAQDQAGNFNPASASYAFTFAAPTIVVAPTNSTLPNGTQGTAYSLSFSASGGTAPYTYAITAGAVPTGMSLTSGGTLAGTPTANGTFNFTVTATDNSAAPGPYSGSRAYSLTIAAPAVTAVTWTGNVSTDWFTAGNWTQGVPNATIDATIPTAPSGGRFPNISAGTAQARNFTLNDGARLIQSGGTLVVAANLTNNGTFQPTGGTVLLGNTTFSNIFGAGNIRFWNLTAGPSGVQLSTSIGASVQRLLLLNGNFSTNGNSFVLESNANLTAQVTNNNGVVNGNVTVQRYIDPSLNPNLGYRHVSTAVSGQTVGSLATGNFSPAVNPAYNTSAQPGTVKPFPTVYGYDQNRLATTTNNLPTFDKGWFSPNALSDPLNVGQGYTALISGGQTWAFTGPLNNGTQTLTLARNSGATAADAGLSLVGNPYPSPLDWRQVASTGLSNVDGALYVFQSNDPNNPYTGSYGVYANNVGTISPVLAQGQGFFVRVTQGQTSGTLTLTNSQRPTTYTATTYQRTAAETRPLVQLSLKAAGHSTGDDAFVYFEQGSTEGFDSQYDARKMPNPSGLNLSTTVGSEQFSIDGRPAIGTVQRVIPLAVGVPTAGAYSLSSAQLLNLDTTPVYLRDLQTGALIDLAQQPTYQFTVTNASALITNRFELVFSPQKALATVPAALAQQVALYPNPAKTAAFVELPASLGRQAVTATLVDALGREVRTVSLPAQGATAHQLDLHELATGVYALRLSTSAGVVVKKLVVE